MRSELSKIVRKTFERALAEKLPIFSKAKVKDKFGTDTCYEWPAFTSGAIYLFLEIDSKDDRFTVDVVWTVDGTMPFGDSTNKPEKEISARVMSFRLCALWTREDYWWEVGKSPSFDEVKLAISQGKWWDEEPIEKAKTRIPELIDDCIKRTIDYGSPFFKRLIEKHRR